MNQGIWASFLRYCELNSPSHWRFIALDLPGYGLKSEDDHNTYDLTSIANKVAQELPPQTILLGWSMGGLIAQQIVNSGQQKVLGHIQVASSPKFMQASDWHGIRPEVLNMFTTHINSGHVALLKRFLAIQCLGLPQPKQQMKAMYDAICEYPLSKPSILLGSLALLVDTDLRPTYDTNIHSMLPCLRIFGGLDSLIPAKNIASIQALYPNDSTLLISKASHAPFLTHPQETFTAINTFIKSRCGQSGK